MTFLTEQLVAVICKSSSVNGELSHQLFSYREKDFAAAAALATKVVAFREPFSTKAHEHASRLILAVLDYNFKERPALINGSMGEMAERDLLATCPAFRQRKARVEEQASAGVGPTAVVPPAGGGAMAVIHLLLRIASNLAEGDQGIYSQLSIKSLAFKRVVNVLLFLMLHNVSTAFEDLRASGLLATVVATILQRDYTPSLLWLCAHKNLPVWVPGYLADVLLKRIPAPITQGLGRYLSTDFIFTSKTLVGGMAVPKSNYDVATGRRLLLDALLTPERAPIFLKRIARKAHGMCSLPLYNLLKEAANRHLLGPGGEGVLDAADLEKLGEVVNLLKLAMEGSPESVCVLRAVKGKLIDHLRDFLGRIEVEFVKQKKAFKPLNIKIPFFEELIVSLAGLDQAQHARPGCCSSVLLFLLCCLVRVEGS
jgi:hypothetical protein